MKPILTFIIISLLFIQSSLAQGLRFYGDEHPIDERTSYNVFKEKNVSFVDEFEMKFDLALTLNRRMGYIVRIKNEENNPIYNLFYEEKRDHWIFKLNEEGKSSIITTKLSKSILTGHNWVQVKIHFNLKEKLIKLYLNDDCKEINNIAFADKYQPKIFFGKSDYIIDISTFSIKNLTIGNSKTCYTFPLRENTGKKVHSTAGEAIGEVKNPYWLINDVYNWQKQLNLSSTTQSGSDYNKLKKEFYYFNKDSIYIYNIRTHTEQKIAFELKAPINLITANSFVDAENNQLYVYELFDKSLGKRPTMARLDLDTYKWDIETHEGEFSSELHHHAYFFNSNIKEYVIMGGYGEMTYSNKMYSYSLEKKRWKEILEFNGDPLFPRYFSSMTYNNQNDVAYIFGGMGNESGEHIVGRKYFYDLHQIDFKTKEIKKLWDIAWELENVVPARQLVLSNDSSFYALCYPEHQSNSFLQLYKFAIHDGNYVVLGDSIPIYSDRITTRAKLYYDEDLNKLFTIVQESKDDIGSSMSVYSLDFAPISYSQLEYYPIAKTNIWIIIAIIISIVFMIIFVIYFRLKKMKQNSEKLKYTQSIKKEKVSFRKNSIYLFGEFTAIDNNDKNITYLFSTRLKQMLCLILDYTTNEGGITSQRLSNLIWPDSSKHKTKNVRGVTLNHLRKALSDIEGIELVYDKGLFKFNYTDDFYCDYIKCKSIMDSPVKNEAMAKLIEITNRGKFLLLLDDPIFDNFKMNLENSLEPILFKELDKQYIANEYQICIDICTSILNIDPLSDKALQMEVKSLVHLKRDAEAMVIYQKFVQEYQRLMGSSYTISYQEILKI